MADPLQRLQQSLGYQFSDGNLLELALTHRSCGSSNNERLEFLGDSVLNHLITVALFEKFSGSSEGELSRMRASLVRGETLAELAREFELGQHIRLGGGEKKSGGHRRDSILADAVEALLGAILLDSDLEHCRQCVVRWYAARLQQVTPEETRKDAKTSLQELLQGQGLALPEYELVGVEGEDHRQQFTVSCRVVEKNLARDGTGSSRRKAEQDAAAAMLEVMHDSR